MTPNEAIALSLHKNGASLSKIARTLNCSRPRASQLISQAKGHILRHSLFQQALLSLSLQNIQLITLAFYALDPSLSPL